MKTGQWYGVGDLYCSQKVGDIRIAKIITFTKRMS